MSKHPIFNQPGNYVGAQQGPYVVGVGGGVPSIANWEIFATHPCSYTLMVKNLVSLQQSGGRAVLVDGQWVKWPKAQKGHMDETFRWWNKLTEVKLEDEAFA